MVGRRKLGRWTSKQKRDTQETGRKVPAFVFSSASGPGPPKNKWRALKSPRILQLRNLRAALETTRGISYAIHSLDQRNQSNSAPSDSPVEKLPFKNLITALRQDTWHDLSDLRPSFAEGIQGFLKSGILRRASPGDCVNGDGRWFPCVECCAEWPALIWIQWRQS